MAEQADIAAADNWFLGEDKVLEFTVVDSAGAAVNITGWALEWILRSGAGERALLTKTVGSGVTITGGAGGVCQVAIADTDTDDLAAGRYWHALRRTDAGNEAVLSYGQVVLRAR